MIDPPPPPRTTSEAIRETVAASSVQALCRELPQLQELVSLALTGSFAAGLADAHSDINISVVLWADPDSTPEAAELHRLLSRSLTRVSDHPVRFDPITSAAWIESYAARLEALISGEPFESLPKPWEVHGFQSLVPLHDPQDRLSRLRDRSLALPDHVWWGWLAMAWMDLSDAARKAQQAEARNDPSQLLATGHLVRESAARLELLLARHLAPRKWVVEASRGLIVGPGPEPSEPGTLSPEAAPGEASPTDLLPDLYRRLWEAGLPDPLLRDPGSARPTLVHSGSRGLSREAQESRQARADVSTRVARVREAVEAQILPALTDLLGPDREELAIFLTGSLAYGYLDPWSDIDIVPVVWSESCFRRCAREINRWLAGRSFEARGIELGVEPLDGGSRLSGVVDRLGSLVSGAPEGRPRPLGLKKCGPCEKTAQLETPDSGDRSG